MWVKYTGKVTYNSMEVRGFKPNTSKSVTEEVGKYLLKTFPKEFNRSGPPSKEVVESVSKSETKEEVPEVKVEEVIPEVTKKGEESSKKKEEKKK